MKLKFYSALTAFLLLTVSLAYAFPASPVPPSYHQGYARYAGESAYPPAWRGLVAAWGPALGQSGRQLREISGHGLHGTLSSGLTTFPQWVIGGNPRLPGYALDFESGDGIDGGDQEYVDLGTWSIGGSSISFFCWFRVESFTPNDARLLNKSSDTSQSSHVWMLSFTSSGGIKLRVRLKVGGTTVPVVATSGNLSADTWYFGGFTYDGANIRIYLDAVEVGSGTASGTLDASSDTVLLGNGTSTANGDGTNGPFDGLMSLAFFHNRALPPAEIQFYHENPMWWLRLRDDRAGKAVAAAVQRRIIIISKLKTKALQRFDLIKVLR